MVEAVAFRWSTVHLPPRPLPSYQGSVQDRVAVCQEDHAMAVAVVVCSLVAVENLLGGG